MSLKNNTDRSEESWEDQRRRYIGSIRRSVSPSISIFGSEPSEYGQALDLEQAIMGMGCHLVAPERIKVQNPVNGTAFPHRDEMQQHLDGLDLLRTLQIVVPAADHEAVQRDSRIFVTALRTLLVLAGLALAMAWVYYISQKLGVDYPDGFENAMFVLLVAILLLGLNLLYHNFYMET